jgi:hypothetical protein
MDMAEEACQRRFLLGLVSKIINPDLREFCRARSEKAVELQSETD